MPYTRPVVDGKLQCKLCKEWKDAKTEFAWHKDSRSDKLRADSYCVVCKKTHQPTYDAAHYKQNRERILQGARERTWKLKLTVIAAYGGKCACCGETRPQFLTVDHIYNDGAQDRGARSRAGVACYIRLRRAGFPKDRYQLLCFNCNCAKGFYGVCPHETERMEAQNG
jgi:hypothetical protein